MSDAFDRSRRSTTDTPDGIDRLRAYLLSRSSETWLFFIAGILVGTLIG